MKETDKSVDIKHKYDDIIGMPHHTSATRQRMSIQNRAAQFSPFAALTGFEEAILETARLTEQKIVLDEDAKTTLDEKIQFLQEFKQEKPQVTITYFKKDFKKTGGKYENITGFIRKIDAQQRLIVMNADVQIQMDDIYEIESEVFYQI